MEKGEHLKRQNRPTMLQLQYLQGLSKIEKKRGAQGSIAEYYGVNRSTVNRYFKNCIERGILTESLEFTPAGEEWLERYSNLYENLEKYLEEIGAKPEEIDESLDVMVENIDIHMLELMINAYAEKKSVYKKKENELDQEIQHNLQKCERHPVVFRLYRMNKKQGQGRDSMAMRGFEEIAEIVQENGESYLELKLKEMEAHSRVSGEMMAGKLKTLKYEHNEVLEEADIEDNIVKIPILCFSPPDSVSPSSPTSVSYPFGSVIMKSWIDAFFAASIISSLDAPGFAMAILFAMESWNRCVSCVT